MKTNNGWITARGQIAWVLALIVSTAIVIQLERLDVGSRLSTLEINPMTASDSPWPEVLKEARSRTADPSNATSQDQAALLLALALSVLQGHADKSELAAEAESAIDAIGPVAERDALLHNALNVARGVFGL